MGETSMTLPRATTVADGEAEDHVALDYEARLIRRRRLESAGGIAFLVDLPETLSVEDGQCLVLEDGRRVKVTAAPEALLEVRGNLARLAWHIGNRHTPAEIAGNAIYIMEDAVLADMLRGLGAVVETVARPFEPEGGAYGGHGSLHASHHHGDHGHHHPHDRAHDDHHAQAHNNESTSDGG